MMHAWPADQLGKALSELAHAAGLSALSGEGATVSEAATALGLEAEEVFSTYADFEADLRSLGPAILRLSDSRYLAILRGGGRRIRLVTPSGIRSVPEKSVRDAACIPLEEGSQPAIDGLLACIGSPAGKRAHVRSILLRERLGNRRIQGLWLLRMAPDAPFWQQLRHARVPRRIAALAGLHAVQYSLWIASWWVLGSAALTRRAPGAWFLVWCLLLATLVPCRLCITWLQGSSAIIAGSILKQRLFFGALHLHPDTIRHQGVGQLLGRVIESEAVESLALSGGFQSLLAIVELLLSSVVLLLGRSGIVLVPALLAILLTAATGAWLWLRRYTHWTEKRLAMTHDLVENMIGHRTRLAQQPPAQWHAEEDVALAEYAIESKKLDRLMSFLMSIPRIWLVLALACLSSSHAGLAATLGGVLLAFRALRRFTVSLAQLLAAYVAAGGVKPLFRSRPDAQLTRAANHLLVDAQTVSFRYPDRTGAVLENVTLQIKPGEKIIVEGASGSGKSTLASLLTGLRKASSGSLQVGSIAAAPQFHDNHVLAETFAFNALMARNRTPGPDEISEAETLCRELGLGELLERMPAGMLQLVGESGWQLSHGERSRLYIARALLQRGDLLLLDESFAALDPENLKLVMNCVLRHAPSILVIAHR